MSRYINFFLWVALMLINLPLPAQANFQNRLDNLLHKTDRDFTLALVISDPSTNKVLFEKNRSINFLPASTLKLFTAFAGLYYLGQSYHYQTSIYTNSTQLTNNVLNDNLYLKFSGDPTLTVEDLNQLFKTIYSSGIKKIQGRLIIDDSAQDKNYWSPGTLLEDTKFYFEAPAGAIIINQNTVNATAIISNDLNYVKIINQLNFSDNSTNAELIAKEDNRYYLIGSIQTPTTLKIAVQNSRLFSKQIVENLLLQNHLEVSDGIAFASTPPNLVLVANHRSPDLDRIISVMLKESNNIIANAIFRSLPFPGHFQNDWEKGRSAVKNILFEKLKIPQNELSITDRSGGSIYNLVKPKQLIALLNFIYHTNYENFKRYLPQSGVDGTLKNRMHEPRINVYAKTGTETHISSLAGYIETKKHKTLSFVIMINNGLQDNEHYKLLEDQICYLIYNYY